MSFFAPSFLTDSLAAPLWQMLTASPRPLSSNQLPLRNGQTLSLADSLNPTPATQPAERAVLDQLIWTPSGFEVIAQPGEDGGDLTLAFPSPYPLGRPQWDTALLDWHIARDRGNRPVAGPAMLVLDILRGGNRVSGFVAKLLATQGVHGFVLHLPQNGRRGIAGELHDWSMFLPTLRQHTADARRSRDVIAALPLVAGNIGIQGTSLGGFVATSAAALDNAFDPVILALTGGDLYHVLTRGQADAARVREHLRAVGYTDEKLKTWVESVEPLHIAHRINADRTWLFAAKNDQVVPPVCSQKLARAIGLEDDHFHPLAGNHYTSVMGAGRFLSEMLTAIRTPATPAAA